MAAHLEIGKWLNEELNHGIYNTEYVLSDCEEIK